MAIYGYCRISTIKQSMDRQVRNILTAYPTADIHEETFTGTKFQGRSRLDSLIKRVKSGDTIVFDSVSRMSRDADEGFALYKRLFDVGINLVFLKEPQINTDTYRQAAEDKIQISFDSGDIDANDLLADIVAAVNKYMGKLVQKQIQLAFEQSEKEVQDLQQRTKEGIITAKINGKRIGQPKGTKLTTKKSIEAKAKIKKHNYSFGGTLANEDTWELAKISKMTFYKYKAELLAEAATDS